MKDFEEGNVPANARVDAWRVLAEVEYDAGHHARARELLRQVLATLGDNPRPQFTPVRKAVVDELAEWAKK